MPADTERVIVEFNVTDAPLDLLILPTNHCLICGINGACENGICTRCGATEADVRILLRGGAKAYSEARENALAGRFAEARENLRLAASLGISETESWRRLSDLIDATDPAVTAEDARSYRMALSHACQDQFLDGILRGRTDTPITRELNRLCTVGNAFQKKAKWSLLSRYATVGIACAAMVFWLLPRPTQTPIAPKQNTPKSSLDQTALRRNEIAPPPVAARIETILSPSPYPYPERLARRYYNDALSAYREKQYDTAANLADLAAEAGKNTYLLPHTLLLRAQIADTTGDIDAPRFWAKIARAAPDSSYAPLGLLRAAERAEKIIGNQATVALYLQELIDQYPLSNEAGIARKRFRSVFLPGKMKEEARH